MECIRPAIVGLAASLSFFFQALLLHPDLHRFRRAARARMALTPVTVGLAGWAAWDVRQLYVGGAKHHNRVLVIGLGCGLVDWLLKAVHYGTTSNPSQYSRRPSARAKSAEEEAPGPACLSQKLIATFSLLMSPRGIGWKFGPPLEGHLVPESDHTFLKTTLIRLLTAHYIFVLAFVSLQEALADEPSRFLGRMTSDTAINWLRPWVVTLCGGMLIWTSLDMGSCFGRLFGLALKYTAAHRFTRPLGIEKVDLREYSFLLDSPYRATSLADFWGRHWHSLLKPVFINCGSQPVEYILTHFTGCRSDPIIRAGSVFGAFAVSALLHEFGLWYSTYLDVELRTSIFFLSQGLGICLESAFRRLTTLKVGGFLGRLWTAFWLLYWGRVMVYTWLEHKVLDMELVDPFVKQSTWTSLLTPFSLLLTLLSPTQHLS